MRHVQGPLALPVATRRPVLACGAGGPVAPCLASGDRAWVGRPSTVTADADSLRAYAAAVRRLESRLSLRPELIVRDYDPGLPTSLYARARSELPSIPVQHHHAHAEALLAEHGFAGGALVAVLDGGGLGPDGTVWGGELLRCGPGGYQRSGLLFPVRLPGGTVGVPEPWEMACSWLAAATEGEAPPLPRRLARVGEAAWAQAAERIRTGLESPLTTSAGRLFEAVAALAGMEAGAAAGPPDSIRPSTAYPVTVISEGEAPLILDPRPAILAVVGEAAESVPPGVIAGRFRLGFSAALAAACRELATRAGGDAVGLAGDCFENARLRELTAERLERAGVRVLRPIRLPSGDGAISFGQAAALARLGPAALGDAPGPT